MTFCVILNADRLSPSPVASNALLIAMVIFSLRNGTDRPLRFRIDSI